MIYPDGRRPTFQQLQRPKASKILRPAQPCHLFAITHHFQIIPFRKPFFSSTFPQTKIRNKLSRKVETFLWVPDIAVGKIVGKKGENINKLCSSYNVEIKIHRNETYSMPNSATPKMTPISVTLMRSGTSDVQGALAELNKHVSQK